MSYGINVTYQVKPGCRQEFLDALAGSGLRKAVREEAGCIRYDYFLPLDEPDQVLLVEQWESRDAQQVHLAQPHMAIIRELKERYVDDTVISHYNLTD